jgi:hypothetical protein
MSELITLVRRPGDRGQLVLGQVTALDRGPLLLDLVNVGARMLS